MLTSPMSPLFTVLEHFAVRGVEFHTQEIRWGDPSNLSCKLVLIKFTCWKFKQFLEQKPLIKAESNFNLKNCSINYSRETIIPVGGL